MSEETTDTKSRWITLQVAVAALFVLMIVAPVFIVKFVLTPEWVDENVVPEIEKAIGREVEFEDLGLGFRGLSLKRLSVSENPAFARADLPEFASLDRLVLRVKLLPLLRRRLIISQIVLADPVIVVHRDAEGAFNFSTLGEHGETETGEGQAPEAAEAPPEQDAGDTGEDEDAGEAGLAIVAERIRLQNARVIFINETAEGRAQEKIELRRFNLVAQGFSLEGGWTKHIRKLELSIRLRYFKEEFVVATDQEILSVIISLTRRFFRPTLQVYPWPIWLERWTAISRVAS